MAIRVRAAMPGDPAPIPRARGWWVGALGVVVVMAFVAVMTLLDAGRPNGYLAREWQGPWPYPTRAVLAWLGALAIEGGLIIAWLARRASTSLVARALVAALVVFAVLAVVAPMTAFATSPVTEHVGWMLLVTVWLLVFAVGAWLEGLGRRRAASAS